MCILIATSISIRTSSGGNLINIAKWVKNIGHIRFGRLQRRNEERKNRSLIDALSNQNGLKFNKRFKSEYIEGANEIDLVRAGLDDTMRTAYINMKTILNEKPELEDLRTSAFYSVINNIALHYKSIGL